MDADRQKEAIRILFDAVETLLAEVVVLQQTLDMICDHWAGEEPIDWHLLVSSDTRDKAAQSASRRFAALRAGFLGEPAENRPPLPEGWEEDVRRLLDGLKGNNGLD